MQLRRLIWFTVVSGSVATLLGRDYSSPKRTLYHHSRLRCLGPALVQPDGSCHSDIAAVVHVYRLHARDTFACQVLQCLAFSRHSMSAACMLSIFWPLITDSRICFRATMLPHSCTSQVMFYTLPLRYQSTLPSYY